MISIWRGWNKDLPLCEVSSIWRVGTESSREVSLYTSFQGIGIEWFHCIQIGVLISGAWNRGVPLYTRGVLISGGWNRGVPLYTEVPSFQGVGIEEFHCIQGCPHFSVLE